MAKFTKAKLNKEFAQFGFELVRGPEGYFYWAALPGGPNAVVYANSIYVYRFDALTEQQWRAHAAGVLALIAKGR